MTGGARMIATGPAVRRADPTPSDRYMAVAQRLYRGVKVLAEREPYELGACVFLAAQTLECCLKAWVWEVRHAKTGAVDEVIGHDLYKLWDEAATSGLELAIASPPPDWCVVLNEGHDNPYHFRYLTRGDFTKSPPPATLTAALRSLLDDITGAIRARRNNEAIKAAGG